MSLSLMEVLKAKVLSGPTISEGLVRYRIADLQEFLEEHHGIKYAISTIWYKLQELNLSWKTGRQRHPKSNEGVQEDFKKNLGKL